jgi:hypothetical protein
MIDTLPPQTPEELAIERWRRDEAAASRWPVILGLVGTIVFHVLAYFVADRHLFGLGSASVELVPNDVATLRDKYEKQELTFLLADDTPPVRPMRFVEVNPDAPDNDPGKTDNYGARNQQAAQPVPGNDHSDRGKTTGELENSTAVVTGSREPPAEAVPLAGVNGQNGTGMQAVVVGDPTQPMASEPLPGFEKITGDNPDGIGTNIGKALSGKTDDEKHQDGKKDGDKSGRQMIAVSGGGVAGAPGHPAPRARPKLQNVRPSVLANQPLSASNAGATAVNSRLSEAGVWWDEFISTVDAQFQKLAEDMTARPPSHSVVVVRFTVNTMGEVRILNVEGEEAAGRAATYMCLDAVRARAPYRPWTQDMINMFGNEEEVVFSFYFY